MNRSREKARGSLWLLAGVLGLGLVGAAPTAAQQASGDYQVRVTHDAVQAKHGWYGFNITVRDQQGRRVNDARVYLKLHSFEAPGYRLVPARRAGNGWYRAVAHLHAGLEWPRHVQAVVNPAE